MLESIFNKVAGERYDKITIPTYTKTIIGRTHVKLFPEILIEMKGSIFVLPYCVSHCQRNIIRYTSFSVIWSADVVPILHDYKNIINTNTLNKEVIWVAD